MSNGFLMNTLQKMCFNFNESRLKKSKGNTAEEFSTLILRKYSEKIEKTPKFRIFLLLFGLFCAFKE
jgi:hypothetical protein